MDEQIYKEFEQERLAGMAITDIAIDHHHGHSYYQRNGYVKRFNKEHPNFPETRGRKNTRKTLLPKQKHSQSQVTPPNKTSIPKVNHEFNEDEYKEFEAKKLAGQSMDDILYSSPHGKQYYYTKGFVARFNREHPDHRTRHQSQIKKLSESQIYNAYIDYHRRGLDINDIAKHLHVPAARIKQVINLEETREQIRYADKSLAKQVQSASTRSDKYKIIRQFRTTLIADYGNTLMDVPNNEPRLLALQLANQALD